MRRNRAVLLLVSALVGALVGALAASPGAAPASASAPLARSPELSETTRLADRRTLVTGDRFYQLGTADGRYPAAGFHTRGEMGGFWTPPIKLLDGLWFGVDGTWLDPATRVTTGWGYVRYDLPAVSGVRVTRTDVAPDGGRAGLVALRLDADRARTVSLDVDAHSELVGVYPWGETSPGQQVANLPDTAALDRGALLFRDRGMPPYAGATAHDWAALVGSSLRPAAGQVGRGFRGPQEPPVVCPVSGPGTPPAPARCDDTAYGRGAGGRLTYRLALRPGAPRTVWVAVAGSDAGPAAARAELTRALADPAGALARKVAGRRAVAARTRVDLPGDPLLARSVAWSQQNLADSVQESRHLAVRPVRAGTVYPPPSGTVDRIRWLGAGWPDYPWLFATDGEYSAFAAVAGGQFEPIAAHLRALREVSEATNGGSGKIVHEVTPDGAVYFGANADAGNTDESAKFPSMVALVWRWTGDRRVLDENYGAAVRAMRYVTGLDADADGWPEGLGNVERPGMGPEKLDNAVYTVRGLADLADLAAARGDAAVARWASGRAADLSRRFEATWWYGRGTDSYADSLDDPGNVPVFQRHWIGLTPLDAVLPAAGPLARRGHAVVTLAQHQKPCYSDTFGLFHTGTGPTSAAGGNPGPSCDPVVSAVPSERSVFSLNTAIMAVAQGNYGWVGPRTQGRYTTANARIQLDPSVWELPGAMPEIAPSPGFGANIDKALTERSSVLQAWGAYGVLWPVVHHQLGVSPDLGRGRLTVVPQVPDGQERVAGYDIRLGAGSVDVRASRAGGVLRTEVVRHMRGVLTIGGLLPAGARVTGATLDGRVVRPVLRRTARGVEAVVRVPAGTGRTVLAVRYG